MLRRHISCPIRVRLIALSGCSVSASTSAVRIGSDEISVDEFERIVQQLADVGQLELGDGRVSGDTTRSVLGALLRGMATTQLLAKYDQSVTDTDRNSVLTQLAQDSQSSQLAPELKELIVDLNSGDLALQRVSSPSLDDLEKMYADTPAKLGVMCTRHILVTDESTATKVLSMLSSGGDFRRLQVHTPRSLAPVIRAECSAANENECLALSKSESIRRWIYRQHFRQEGSAYGRNQVLAGMSY